MVAFHDGVGTPGTPGAERRSGPNNNTKISDRREDAALSGLRLHDRLSTTSEAPPPTRIKGLPSRNNQSLSTFPLSLPSARFSLPSSSKRALAPAACFIHSLLSLLDLLFFPSHLLIPLDDREDQASVHRGYEVSLPPS